MKTSRPATKWLIILILAVYPLHAAAGQTIYVDANATGANNGSSWADAYNYLQDALTVAGSGNSIWVAQGSYRPDRDTNNPSGTNVRTATFQLKNNVAIYGGFPTGGGLWESRDPNTYQTSLSGGIGIADNNNDNSYHVLTGSGTNSSAILDGFTITAGNAQGLYPHNRGGGMVNTDGSPAVTNCIFTGNSATDGGGGMYNYNAVESSPTLTNCTFIGNSANGSGGGIWNYSSSPTVTNCTFIGNSANGNGGGIYNYEDSSPILTNCTFSGNSVENDRGGGIYNIQESSPTVTNCVFTGNSANDGGVMCNYGRSNPTVTNCTFTGNSAYNCGGICNYGSSNPTLANCILWGNTSALSVAQIYNENSSPVVSFSDVQGGYSGTGNINADPLFVDAPDNLRLAPDSPCIDDANNSAVPTGIETDLDGRNRFADGDCNTTIIVDMGAYEFTYAYFGDFDSDCDIDFIDFAIQADSWLTNKFLADIAPTPAGDGIVDTSDLAVLCDNWLQSF